MKKSRRPESPVSLRLPREVREALVRAADRNGQSRGRLAARLLAEGLRMQHAPGIYFADAPSGRRACVVGTGMAVWEVAWLLKEFVGDERRLLAAYPALRPHGLRAALAYAKAYPGEIETAIDLNRQEAEAIEERYPFVRSAR